MKLQAALAPGWWGTGSVKGHLVDELGGIMRENTRLPSQAIAHYPISMLRVNFKAQQPRFKTIDSETYLQMWLLRSWLKRQSARRHWPVDM